MSEPTARDELVTLLKENQYGIVAVEPEHLADVILAAGWTKGDA